MSDFGTATSENRSFAALEPKVRWRKTARAGYKITNFVTGSMDKKYATRAGKVTERHTKGR
jgi:hypothetical protein